MNDADRGLILEFKKELDAMAKKGQILQSRGYVVEFNVNVTSGQIENFKVKQTTEIDLASLERKAN